MFTCILKLEIGVNGYPDTQLVSYGEMAQAASIVSEGLSNAALEMNTSPIPCIADGGKQK